METEKALNIVRQLLAPRQLTYLEEVLLVQTWDGRLYREIALDVGYELTYVRDVGSKLWGALSQVTGRVVTKKNVLAILKQQADLRPAGMAQTDAAQTGAAQTGSEAQNERVGNVVQFPGRLVNVVQFPGRSLEPLSPLYIDRPPVEQLLYQTVHQPGSLTRIQAPRQMGKTSLIYRLFDRIAQENGGDPSRLGMRLVHLNLRQVDQPILQDLDSFLRWFCWTVSQELGLAPELKLYWLPEVGAKISCTNYFQAYVLARLDGPLVLAVDDLNRLLRYPVVAQDVLPMFRTWHEEAIVAPIWQKLRLILTHNAEVDLPLPLSQSPFNVGMAMQLPDLTWVQTQVLAERCGLQSDVLSDDDLMGLYDLLGGHPYLLQLAFHWLTVRQLGLAELRRSAASLSGIFRQHLRHYWLVLEDHPNLATAFKQTLRRSSVAGVQLPLREACWLEELGLVRLVDDRAIVSRPLYQAFFEGQWEIQSAADTQIDRSDMVADQTLSVSRTTQDGCSNS